MELMICNLSGSKMCEMNGQNVIFHCSAAITLFTVLSRLFGLVNILWQCCLQLWIVKP